MRQGQVEKFYHNKDRFFGIAFKCSKCDKRIDTFNGTWQEDVPKICPDCNEGIYEIQTIAPGMIDTNKNANWNKNTPLQKQVEILASNSNPY